MQPTTSSEPTPATFQPESFGKYYLIDKVAVGGMAEVFKAKTFSHGGFEKLLVIKRIGSVQVDQFLKRHVTAALPELP